MQTNWQPIETAPTGVAVDVFYVDDTSETLVEGILHQAQLRDDVWTGANGSVSDRYVLSWADQAAGLRKAS